MNGKKNHNKSFSVFNDVKYVKGKDGDVYAWPSDIITTVHIDDYKNHSFQSFELSLAENETLIEQLLRAYVESKNFYKKNNENNK